MDEIVEFCSGWTAAVFDDVLGRLVLALGAKAVTAELDVRYLRPVPVEVDLELRARAEPPTGRRRRVHGELVLGGEHVLAGAQGEFVTVGEDHVARHLAWLAAQGAPTDEAAQAVPIEPCTAESVAAALPERLRGAFVVADHRRLLETWRAQAAALRGPAPTPPGAAQPPVPLSCPGHE